MAYLYHFHCSSQTGPGKIGHYDGVLLADEKLQTSGDYLSAKDDIAKAAGFNAKEMTMHSLSLISDNAPPTTQPPAQGKE